jgi:methylmalonyl-CoA mutase N-terminal domain/subunit
MDPAIESSQVERLRAMRASRSQTMTNDTLDALERAARSSDNLMPRILEACEARATVGEISDRLRRVFGEYRES